MPNRALSAVNRLIRAARTGGDPHDATDGQLIARFVQTRDEPAFRELVRRLGPMVLGVCRRVSGDAHLADDAFQAAFLVLARRAADVRPAEAVRGWLYGVAVRTAREARAVSARRRARETPVPSLPDRPAEPTEPPDADALRILDEEVAGLPDHLRAAVVLCELEGASRKDAAARLGIPEGTVCSRLAKARKVLAARLRKRGVALSAAALAVLGKASASVPSRLADATAALAVALGPVPSAVAVLTKGVFRTMFFQKLKIVLAGGFLSAALAAGALAYPQSQGTGPGLAAGREEKGIGKSPVPAKLAAGGAAPAPRKAPSPDAAPAWGKPVAGLRVGILHSAPSQVSVTLENVGRDDLMLNLGIMLANGKKHLPSGVRLALTDRAGKTRTFQLKGPPGIAGRVDALIVPLPAGSRYTVPCPLDKYADADPTRIGVPLAPGEYRVAAQYTGEKVTRTNADTTGLTLMKYWTGTVKSGEVRLTVPAATK
jgi:RNA polymerase sigma factor (sigma-70 family)